LINAESGLTEQGKRITAWNSAATLSDVSQWTRLLFTCNVTYCCA